MARAGYFLSDAARTGLLVSYATSIFDVCCQVSAAPAASSIDQIRIYAIAVAFGGNSGHRTGAPKTTLMTHS